MAAYTAFEAVARLLLMPPMPKHRTRAEQVSETSPRQENRAPRMACYEGLSCEALAAHLG